MKNFKQKGEKILWTNDSGSAVAAGDLVVIGVRVGVASVDIASTAAGVVTMEGVFEVPKEAPLVIAQGDLVYCNATSGELDKTATAQTLAGFAFVAAASADTVVQVKLNA